MSAVAIDIERLPQSVQNEIKRAESHGAQAKPGVMSIPEQIVTRYRIQQEEGGIDLQRFLEATDQTVNGDPITSR